VLGHDDTDTVGVAFFRRRPLDLADFGRFADIADVENDYALIALGEIGAVFVDRDVVQRNPDLG
jgi:hypothetical protein